MARYTYSVVAGQNRVRFPILRNVQAIAVTKGLRTSVNQTLKQPGRESDHPSPFNTEDKKRGRNTCAALACRQGNHDGN